ncbi:MAG: TetR/AcrR family transcriptional regulator [Trueperaceae bacterium]
MKYERRRNLSTSDRAAKEPGSEPPPEPDAVGKRSYDNSLRQRQQEVTRSSIMLAAQDLVLEGRLHNFSVQQVAARAGVSHRTVYLHFSSRDAILEGLVDRALEETADAIPPYPERLEDLPAWVERAVPALIPYLPQVRAMDAVLQAVYQNRVPNQARRRDELFARLVAEAAPGLSEKERKAAAAGLRLWVSMRTLLELHTRYGLDEEEIILAVTRGARAQIEQILSQAPGQPKGSAK